jgi:fibronectin type 3 domain-containing protein/predicted esterase
MFNHRPNLYFKLIIMKSFTQKLLVCLFVLTLSHAGSVMGQSILDPTDSVYNYDATKPKGNVQNPNYTNGTIAKWVRTKKLTWNTNGWKCYMLNGIPFRLKFPKTYNPTANDGKKYPMLIFFHGAGEKGPSTDNETSLANGGQFFNGSVDNGYFDGYILIQQSPYTYWDGTYLDLAKNIVDYMAVNNKLDPFKIGVNGLSAGGQATWAMILRYPNVVTADLPMSANNLGNSAPQNLPLTKFTPIWNFQGGKDGSPDPNTGQTVYNQEMAAGANYKYTLYPTLGHGTWNTVWAEPDFWPFILRTYASNPWTLFGQTAFCPGVAINVTIGVAPNYNGYQWRRNGVALASTTNTINATDTGVYDCRVLRGTIWSDWSRTPVHITIKQPTVTPPITISGLMSNVIPAVDYSYVSLKVPSGYATYTWQKVGSSTTIGTDSVLQVTDPGQYKVQVMEQYGCSSSFSAPFTVISAAGSPKPDVATGLTVQTLSQTTQLLNWNQNPAPTVNETNFEVYQATKAGGPYKLVDITGADATKDTIKGLDAGKTYYYVVRPVNATGAAAITNEASGTTTNDTQAPTAPVQLTVTGTGYTSVGLSWGASTDNVGVTGYDILVNGAVAYHTLPSQTNFIVYSLTHGQNYVFTVKAKDLAGNSSIASNQVSAKAVINGLTYSYYNNLDPALTKLPDFGTLTPVSSGFMPTTGFISPAPDAQWYAYVYRGFIVIPTSGTYTFQTTSDDASRMWLGSLNSTTDPYSYSGTPVINNDKLQGATTVTSSARSLSAGIYPVTYAYMNATGGATMTVQWKTPGTSSFVTMPNSAFQEANTIGAIPAAPVNVKATAQTYNSIGVTWTDNSNNETGFEIYRATAIDGAYVIVGTRPANANSFTDSSCQASSTYYYKVQAVNANGGSGFDPASLTGLNFNYYTIPNTWTNMSQQSTLTPAKTGAAVNVTLAPALSTTNYSFKFVGYITAPVTGTYTFYTSSDDGSNLYVGGFDSAHLVVANDKVQGTTEKSGTVSLTAGVKYPYFVQYFQISGGAVLTTSWTVPGGTKTAIPDSVLRNTNQFATTLALPAVPAAPSALTATATGPTSISISWTENANNEDKINLFRSSGNNQNYVPVATLPANATSFVDSGLFANTVYYYKAQASNVGGNSGYSNESNARTLGINPVIVDLGNQQARYGTTTVIPLSATSAANATLTLSGRNLPSFVTLTDNGDGTGKLTVTPSVANAGDYPNLSVIASDAFGGADTTVFTLSVNNNYPPTLDSIANYSINEGDSLNVSLTAHNVNPSDILTLAVSGLPSAYTLTQGSNGTASLVIRPNYAAAGTYTVTATVNDNNGYSTSRTFTLTVGDKNPVTRIFTRVQANNAAPLPWNNVTGPTTTGLKDENGATTSVGLSFQPSSWWMPYGYGGTSTNNNSGVYPDVVLQEYYYFNYFGGPSNPNVVVTGLDPAKKYDLTFLGSSTFSNFANNGRTTWTVGSQTVALAVQSNTQNTVTLSSLAPAADGTISVLMGTLDNTPGYLNSLVIANHFDDSTAPAKPLNLQAQAAQKGVGLTWQDAAYNEDNYKVYRSTGDSLSFSLIGTVPAGSTSFTDSTISGTTKYYYKVTGTNAYGTGAYSDLATFTTADRLPTVNAIANVTVNNNQSVQVNVTAVDDPSDHLTLAVANLPNFATFADNGNGTGTITITPTAGLQGSFSGVTVIAKDGSDSTGSASFTINVVDPSLSYTYVNLSSYANQAPSPWNNLLINYIPSAGYFVNNLLDQTGVNTGMTLTLTDAWTGVSNTGMQRRNGSDLYPEVVSNNAIYATDANNHRITITGLNTSKRYNFQFFASHFTSESCLTNITINGQTIGLNGSYNSNKTVQINNVTPDGSGSVVINCVKDASASFALISAIVIQSFDPGSLVPFSPGDLRVLDYSSSNSVTLQWQDRASNETGYQIWRAPDGGTYSLVTTVAANTTTYKDANLTANTTYNYVVRAANGVLYSAYSNPVKGYTYASTVFLNLNGSTGPNASAPWNQTDWVNQTTGNVWNNFKDEAGFPTNVGLIQATPWDAVNDHGVSTGNNSGIFPDAVMAQSFGLFIGDTARLTFTGLDIAKTYDFTLFASCTDAPTHNATARYNINGKQSLLNSYANKSGTVTMFGIKPDQNGRVDFSAYAYDSSNASFALIGVAIIKGYTPSTNTISPAPAMAQAAVVSATANDLTPLAATADDLDSKPLGVYPNPFDQTFTLTVPAHANDNVLVMVTDLSGRTLYKKMTEGLIEGTNLIQVQTDGAVAPGVYFVSVIYTNRNERKVLKVVKR